MQQRNESIFAIEGGASFLLNFVMHIGNDVLICASSPAVLLGPRNTWGDGEVSDCDGEVSSAPFASCQRVGIMAIQTGRARSRIGWI